jgi:hypothetical protein
MEEWRKGRFPNAKKHCLVKRFTLTLPVAAGRLWFVGGRAARYILQSNKLGRAGRPKIARWKASQQA